MNTPQLSRKQEIQKGCNRWIQGTNPQETCGVTKLCSRCKARLDERIRAEQDFLKMIDDLIIETGRTDEWGVGIVDIDNLKELKSTIKQEKQ
jgi:hypothetical protein